MAGTQNDILDILRQKAEIVLSGKNAAAEELRKEDIGRLFHELQVYQLELEMQVDELRVSTESLELQKNKFKLLFEMAPAGYLVINRRGIIEGINRSGVALLDVASQNMAINNPLTAFIDPADTDIFYFFLKDLFDSGERQQRVLRLKNKLPKPICVQVSGVLFREYNQEPVCYLMLTDISALQQAELKLNSAKRKLEIALDVSMTGIWEVDTRNGHIFLDNFCQSIFEFRSFDFDNRIESMLDRIHPEDRMLFESDLRRAIVSNNEFMAEFRVQSHIVPYTRYIQARARAAESDQFIGIMIDFTEKRQLEEESKRLKDEQEQMILAASIYAEEKEKKRTSEALHDGIAQQLYALKLSLDSYKNSMGNEYSQFNDLLNSTITDLRNISFELTPAILIDFGLNEALREMANRLSGPNLKISLTLARGLKDLEIDFQLCIYRIIQELVNNGIRHGHASQISIDINQIKDAVKIIVTDNGAGFEIKKDQKHRLGMGLASIRNRLKLYNGTLEITSKINKGTRVNIILKQFN